MAAALQNPAEYLSTAVVTVDGALRARYLNPAAEALFGLSLRAALDRPVAAWLPDELVVRIERSLADGTPWVAREYPLAVAATMQVVTVDVTLNPASPGLAVLEVSALDRHLRISREEHLQAQHAASRALVRGLAHEIKNPLGGLRGAAQLLDRKLDEPAMREYTRVIIAEADRLGGLVDAMLGPARPPVRAELNVHEVTERVATLVESEARVRIHRDYDPSLPPLHADRDQLVQALLNVVLNAAQAAGGEGNVTVRTRIERQVTLGGVRHRQAVCVDVIDDGPGIASDMLESIFLPLVTTRPEGTGLGLSIAQALIARHGGLIECASEPGKTVFTLLLPIGESR